MIATQESNLPFVLFQVKGNLYGIASQRVREIVILPRVTPVPNTPPEVRGVINLRGKIIQVMDLRVKLGLPPLRSELDALKQLLREREQDHRRWLAELEACVRERRPFEMERDPHQCKFGRWYDQYRTEDRLLRMTLPSMDEPHKAIHATADEALHQAENGDTQGALRLIASRRSRELAGLVKLFAESQRILVNGHRELGVVLSRGTDQLALSADLVEEVERIPEDRIEPMPAALSGLNNTFQCRVGRRPATNQTVLLINVEFFFHSATARQ